jgi:hypothetical protein
LVSVASLTVPPHRWRLILFGVLAGLLPLAYLPGVLLFAVGSALDGEGAPEPVGAHRGVGPGPAPGPPALHLEALGGRRRNDRRRPVRVSRRPLARPLLLQFLALALVADLCANVPLVPGIIVAYSPILLKLVIYPEPRRLPAPFWQRPIDWSVQTLAVVVGAFFVPDVWRAWQAQVRGGRRTGPQQRLGEHRRTSV